ncbi:MAG: HAD family hydrolase [Anaerolineae bacterium]
MGPLDELHTHIVHDTVVELDVGIVSRHLAGDPQVQPIGDVSSAIARLAQAGVRIAIITSDDRAATEATLPLLGIAGLVDVLVCGDDDVPNKPAPDALWQMGRQFDVDPAQMLMVGDTAGDMIFGRNAGVSGCIGIRGGAGDPFKLSHHANSIVDSINCIEVVNPLTDSPRLV